MYHRGQRELQESFGSTALADRLYERLRHERFTDADKAFIEGLPFFFLATADAEGRPDCSYKGGDPGFVRVVAPDRLMFPDYDGNGMFRSLGNVAINPHVGLLFLGVGPRPARLRVNGRARVLADDPAMADWPGAQMLVEVTPSDIFPNCPRYIPELELKAASPYVPREGEAPVEPAWKSFGMFSDVVPRRRA